MKFKDHHASSRVKLLLLGDSGNGKTTSLATLANAGYNLRIMDFDDGLDVLHHYLNKDAYDRVEYVKMIDADKTYAITRAKELIYKEWPGFDTIDKWTNQDVLVIDSMTSMSESAKRYALAKAGKSNDTQLSQADWGEAQRKVTDVIARVMSANIQCNVVVTAHLRYIDEEAKGITKVYPASCGRGIETTIGSFFNNTILLEKYPKGGKIERRFRTAASLQCDLKVSAPGDIAEIEEPDLAKLFDKIKASVNRKLEN